MKLANILLLERTLEYHSDEYLQAVQLAKSVIRRSTTECEEELCIAKAITTFDRIQKEIYEFWGNRIGSKIDELASGGLPNLSPDYRGVTILTGLLQLSNHVESIDQSIINLTFPPKIAKLISRGKDFFSKLFDNSNVVINKSTSNPEFYSYTTIATKYSEEECTNILDALDTWTSVMSRVEFYYGQNNGSVLYLNDDSIKQQYINSDVSAHVSQHFVDLMKLKINDAQLGHEDLADYRDHLLHNFAIMELIVSKCLELSSATEVQRQFFNINYEIDPTTKLFKKQKNSQGKMVPIVHINHVNDKPVSHLAKSDPITSTMTNMTDRYRYRYNSSKEYATFRALVEDLRSDLSKCDSLMSDIRWLRKPQLENKWGKFIDVDFALSHKFREKNSAIETFRTDLTWPFEYENALSSNHNDQQYSETNPPTNLIKLLQQAETEIVFLAKLFMWM